MDLALGYTCFAEARLTCAIFCGRFGGFVRAGGGGGTASVVGGGGGGGI